MIRQLWLEQTSSLLECTQEHELTAHFMETLQQQLSLSDSILLVLSADGRRLILSQFRVDKWLNVDSQADWDVTDFSHPFAHVLQTGKPMVLDHFSLAYWLEEVKFVQLVSGLPPDINLLMFPLIQDNCVSGLLIFTVSRDESKEMLQDQQWQHYCGVFMRHWQLLNTMASQSGQATFLADSLSQAKDEIRHQKNLQALSLVLVGDADNMIKLRGEILRVSDTDLSVMVQGATGTGKELVAKAIHNHSKRHDEPFIAINCAAIPENLLESELFGYEKGAFSGANVKKKGLIALANKGTLFLDEIGDMPLNLQSKLLRVLESGNFRGLGASKEEHSNFRLVAATHVNLKQRVDGGDFRRDLYYRLCQFPIHVPALNDRLDDITVLVNHFINGFNRHHSREITGVRYETLLKLKCHNYPGNVRELRNIIEYACALTNHHGELEVSALPEFESAELINLECVSPSKGDFVDIEDLRSAVADFERQVIRDRLHKFKGDRGKAAISLGMPKRTFSHKCLKLEINE
ncbi:MAG: sigma-54 dependent transcriptional regulator [Shewanella sp.]